MDLRKREAGARSRHSRQCHFTLKIQALEDISIRNRLIHRHDLERGLFRGGLLHQDQRIKNPRPKPQPFAKVWNQVWLHTLTVKLLFLRSN